MEHVRNCRALSTSKVRGAPARSIVLPRLACVSNQMKCGISVISMEVMVGTVSPFETERARTSGGTMRGREPVVDSESTLSIVC